MKLTAESMLLFPVGSARYLQLAHMLNRYTLANTENITMNPDDKAQIGRPV